jgi:phage baseplate assembly protein V
MDYEADTVFGRDSTGRNGEIRTMFRQGKVIEQLVDETRVDVRVQWLDKDKLISKPLPVKQHGSRSTSSFYCPKIGDDVSVTMLPNSNGGDGFIDGSFYNVGNPPPTIDPNVRHWKFVDGTIIEYAEKGPATPGARASSGTGTLTVHSVGPIDIKCSGPCFIESGGPMVLRAPALTIEADVTIKGNLTVSGISNLNGGGTANPRMTNADGSGNGS